MDSSFEYQGTQGWVHLLSVVCHHLTAQLCLTLGTPWTVAHQTPPSMGFSRQEDWSGVSFPTPGHLPDRGIEPTSPALAGGFSTTEPLGTWLPIAFRNVYHFQLEGFGKRATCTETETCRAHIGSTHQNAKGVKVKVKSLGRVQFFVTPWTVSHQAPPSMGFSRQEYWSGLPFPSPGDLPNQGIKPGSPALQAEGVVLGK